MKFQIGDRVILISEFADYEFCRNEDLPKGSTGMVCEIAYPDRIGVSWDNYHGGHDCDGSITDSAPGSGFYVDAAELALIVEDAEDTSVDIDSLL